MAIETGRRLSVKFEPPHPKPGAEVTIRVTIIEPSPDDVHRVEITIPSISQSTNDRGGAVILEDGEDAG